METLANIDNLIESRDFIPILAIAGGLLIAIIAITLGTLRSIVVARAREQTKRELAAYVAEGSIDADKAVALANAGKRDADEKSCC